MEKELQEQMIKEYEQKYSKVSKEDIKSEIKQLIKGIDYFKDNIKLIELIKKKFSDNPRKVNPVFEYENDEDYLKLYKKLHLVQIDTELEKYSSSIESAEFKLNYLKTLVE